MIIEFERAKCVKKCLVETAKLEKKGSVVVAEKEQDFAKHLNKRNLKD